MSRDHAYAPTRVKHVMARDAETGLRHLTSALAETHGQAQFSENGSLCRISERALCKTVPEHRSLARVYAGSGVPKAVS
jgi:hypothetical protein